MIAELFYPRELKEIIADLRAKDDLNAEALNRINCYIFLTLKKISIAFVLLSVFLFFVKADLRSWVIFYSVFLIFPFSIYFELKRYSKKILNLYNYGSFAKGTVTSYGSHRGAYGLSCSFVVGSTEYLSHLSGIRIGLERDEIKKNQSINICFNSNDPAENAPYIHALANLFYLRKEKPNAYI